MSITSTSEADYCEQIGWIELLIWIGLDGLFGLQRGLHLLEQPSVREWKLARSSKLFAPPLATTTTAGH